MPREFITAGLLGKTDKPARDCHTNVRVPTIADGPQFQLESKLHDGGKRQYQFTYVVE